MFPALRSWISAVDPVRITLPITKDEIAVEKKCVETKKQIRPSHTGEEKP